jgi:hypothetical protein
VTGRAILILSIPVVGVLLNMYASIDTPSVESSWIESSNQYTRMLLAVEYKHDPEAGSRQGLKEYDSKISQPS